ncbi:DUF1145 domain-containing protein [Shewanella sp. AS1]|uniref:DUF1145 domain-containing protein n=1 Tax=Shewanella sp. AS1 TaxID=2907626 RepID=UPI001F2FC9F5|nr:DUF1145 domain-containing protein [Shewanella sp. AS1]MCE9680133.1 DUF1145 domain-containing protein [Shewanella sp. AS1]
MKLFILSGKVITLFAWALMLYNLPSPIGGDIGLLLSLLFIITLFMHAVQVLIFHIMFKALMPIRKRHYLWVLLFGVFSLLEHRQQLLAPKG